jgi:hypothetical protein
MLHPILRCLLSSSALIVLLGALAPPARPQTAVPKKVVPKLEAVAETKLLMEGLANANFRGLDRLLDKKPAEEQAWLFARGQALLLAETANLLMLRPPKKEGQAEWFDRAMEMRAKATQLAQTIAKRDYDGARSGLVTLANSCNRCHQTFRVAVEIAPFAQAPAAPEPSDK